MKCNGDNRQELSFISVKYFNHNEKKQYLHKILIMLYLDIICKIFIEADY